jgi:hypothetical protein
VTTEPLPRQPPTAAELDQAERLMAAINEIAPTSYRDPSPIPAIGTTPPVPQPGIPPMSQQATDIGRAAMYCGLATVPPGLIAIGIMVASQHADPTVIGMICAAPAALAIPILAIARLMRGAKPEPDVHHHYNGPVDQRHVHTTTKGVWARTNNQQ